MSLFSCAGGGFAIINGELRFSFVPPRRTWSEGGQALYADRIAEARLRLLASVDAGYETVALFSDQLGAKAWPALSAQRGDPYPGRSWPIESREAAQIVAALTALETDHRCRVSSGHRPGAPDPG